MIVGIAVGGCALAAIIAVALFFHCKTLRQARAARHQVTTQNPAFTTESVGPQAEETVEELELGPARAVEEFEAVGNALNLAPDYAAVDEPRDGSGAGGGGGAGAGAAPFAVYMESNPNQPQVYDDAKEMATQMSTAGPSVIAPTAVYLAPNLSQPGVYDAKKKSPKRKTKRGRGNGPCCARGDESGGKACNHPPLVGTQFCANHSCEHPGCKTSKSSGDRFCGKHLPAGTRPRAATLARGVVLQAAHGEAPAHYDVLVPGYLYADLKGAQQQYGSKPVVVRAGAAYTGFNDAFGIAAEDSDEELEV